MDATLKSLQILHDPSKYRIVKDVPIFKPHVRKDKDGKELFKVSAERIKKIAQNISFLEKQTGFAGRLTAGHVKPGEPQEVQPKLYGLWINAREGAFGPEQEPCVLVDYAVRVEDWEEFSQHPYRSAEYYPNRDVITGVACLKTDPELDLGVLAFETDEPCYHYAMPLPPVAHPTPGMTGAPAIPGSPVNPQHMAFHEYMQSQFPHLAAMHAEYAAKCGPAMNGMPPAGGASTGGPNAGPGVGPGFVPGPTMPKKKESKPYESETQPMTATPEAPVNYEARIADLEKQVKDVVALNTTLSGTIETMKKDSQIMSYERELESLNRDYIFNYERELALVKDFSPEQFAVHRDIIMENYQKRPHALRIPEGTIGRAITDPAVGKQITKDQHEKAVRLACSKGIGYEAACAEVLSNGAV